MPNVARFLRKNISKAVAFIPGIGPGLAAGLEAANQAYERSGVGIDLLGSGSSGSATDRLGAVLGAGSAFNDSYGAQYGAGGSPGAALTPDQQLAYAARGAKQGAAIDRSSALNQYKDRYNFLRSEGATLPEAMGIGSGTTAQGTTGTLGNQAGAQAVQAQQLKFEADQRAADRAVQLSGQNAQLQAAGIAANAQLGSAGINASASDISSARALEAAGLSASAVRFVALLTDKRERDLLIAKMGVDNLLATVLANKHNIKLDQPPTEKQFDAFLQDFLSTQGTWARNVEGFIGLIGRWMGIDPNNPVIQGAADVADSLGILNESEVSPEKVEEFRRRLMEHQQQRMKELGY